MEDIKVGEYVRTRQGRITRLIKIAFHNITIGHGLQESQPYCKFENSHFIPADNKEELYKKINAYVVKHSFNLIDLIEEKDFVNGSQVVGINYINDTIDSVYTNEFLFEEDIRTILTHEQFEANCYKTDIN